MGPYQVLPLWFKVDVGVIAMKELSLIPIAPSLEPHHQMQFSVISGHSLARRGGYYSSAEKQVVYSTAATNWAGLQKKEKIYWL